MSQSIHIYKIKFFKTINLLFYKIAEWESNDKYTIKSPFKFTFLSDFFDILR